jgi:hypothetical protein
MAGHGVPNDYETSRSTHFLGTRLTDGVKVVNLTRRPAITPFKIPCAFMPVAESTLGLLKRSGKLKIGHIQGIEFATFRLVA